VARQAEGLGLESIWLFDHFQTVPKPIDELTFESFTALSALATLTKRVRLGQLVICNGFRNPALVAKMIATMDVISGGRMDLGIGAGWKRDEWLAYGYGFPVIGERLAALGDALEVIVRMLAPGRSTHASYEGGYARVNDAINLPKSIQSPRVPIMVGGNGPNVTWRLAAKHADELNLDGLLPAETGEALKTIRSRCAEIGRDPETLKVSVHMWPEHSSTAGQERIDRLAAYRELGIYRVMPFIRETAQTDEALESLTADARTAGLEFEDRTR
jgi:alkanesulfonate monooxygenase SsuD/methylene tetrahydromethanopterin reductase-like flavin-dependent oxidoreductase (luciferase family)